MNFPIFAYPVCPLSLRLGHAILLKAVLSVAAYRQETADSHVSAAPQQQDAAAELLTHVSASASLGEVDNIQEPPRHQVDNSQAGGAGPLAAEQTILLASEVPKSLEGGGALGHSEKVHHMFRARDSSRRISLNRFGGLSLLLLAGVLWRLHIAVKDQPAAQAAKSVYDGAAPHSSALTVAAHALNELKGSSLLLLGTLPLWRGVALAGVLRVLLSISQAARVTHISPDVYPSISGLFELVTALSFLLIQEFPADIIEQTFGSRLVSPLASGLLVAGLLLLVSSAYRVAQWKRRRKLQKPHMPALGALPINNNKAASLFQVVPLH
ncbi:hypothetical protein Efla_006927 [Eimeria flavescens]